jgi:hypothetical protein
MSNSIETPPSPQIDSGSIIEKGDVIESHSLSSGTFSSVVGFKDGHKAFFAPAASPLEAVVFAIDKLLGFNLVPVTVNREVNQQQGHLDEMIFSAKPAIYYKNWDEMVQPQEIQKAAVLDFILDSRDRRKENFLVDESDRTLWLINNDRFMFFSGFDSRDIFRTAVNRGLTALSPEVLSGIERLNAGLPSLVGQAKDKEVMDILSRAGERVRTLLEKKSISA